jgi:exopolysaccharide production protein ExoF
MWIVSIAALMTAAPVVAQQPNGEGVNPGVVVAQAQRAANAAAQSRAAAPGAREQAAGKTKGLLVTSAERISLRVPEYPVLAGEYRISDDETVSLPIVGRLKVSNLSPADLEQMVSEDLKRRTGRESHVTIEIVDYKPVFVTGYVARAGATPWKPGYTVMHAESLAGGVFRPTDASTALPADSEKARAVRAGSDLARVLVHLARLNADKEGKGSIVVPPQLLELVSKKEAEQLVAAQNTMLSSRRAAFEAQLKSLQRSRALAEEEVDGLKQQLARLDEQLKLRREYKDNVGGLVKKGLVRYERSLEEQTRLVDIEERRTNVVVALSRINSALASLSRELDVMQQERLANLDMEVIRVEREASQLRLDLNSSRSAYRKLTGRDALGAVSGNASAGDAGQPALIYEIVRNKDGVPVTTRAEWLTPLQPGDLVVVRLQEASTQ